MLAHARENVRGNPEEMVYNLLSQPKLFIWKERKLSLTLSTEIERSIAGFSHCLTLFELKGAGVEFPPLENVSYILFEKQL